jgi:hypothetical protein
MAPSWHRGISEFHARELKTYSNRTSTVYPVPPEPSVPCTNIDLVESENLMTITVTPTVPSLSYKTGNPLTAYVNAVVVGLSSDGQLAVVSDSIPKSAATKIAAAFKEVGATGSVDEVTRIPAGTFADAEVISWSWSRQCEE